MAFGLGGGNEISIRLTLDNHGLKSGLADSRSDVGKSAGFFRSALSTGLGVVGAGLFSGAASGALNFGKGLLMANANAEMLRTTLEIATGSADRAAMVFGKMQQMAAATPFEFSELTAGAARIEAFGQDSTKVMGVIGDTAAGTMKSIDQVTAAYLDAGMGQFVRLQELGVDVEDKGETIKLKYFENGKAIVKEVDKNNAALIQSTVAAIWNSKYEGAMKKQSKTFLGQWSTLKDNFNLTMQRMSGGVFSFARDGLDAANRFFDRFNDKQALGLGVWDSAMSSLHTTLNQTLGRGAGDIIIGTLRGIGDAVGAIGDIAGRVAGAVGGLFSSLRAGDLSGFASQLWDDLVAVANNLPGVLLAKAWVSIGQWVIGKIPDLWPWLMDAIGVTSGGKFIGRGDGTEVQQPVTLSDITVNVRNWVLGEVDDLWEWFNGAIGVTASGFIGKGDGTEQQGAVSLTDVAVNVAGWAAGTIADIAAWLTEKGKAAVAAGIDIGAVAVSALPRLASDIWGAAGNAYDWFIGEIGLGNRTAGAPISVGDVALDAVLGLAGTIQAVATDVGGWISSQLRAHWDGITNIGNIALDGVLALGGAIKAAADNFTQWVKDNLHYPADGIIQIGKVVLQGDVEVRDTTGGGPDQQGRNWAQKFVDGVHSTVGAIHDAGMWIGETFFGAAGLAFGAGIGGLVSLGALAVNGIIKGIKDPSKIVDAWQWFSDTLYGSFTTIMSAFRLPFDWFWGRVREGIDSDAPWLGPLLQEKMGDLTGTLTQKGADLIVGLRSGIDERWATLKTWFGHLGGYIFDAVGDVSASIKNKGIDLLTGLRTGIDERWATLKTWCSYLGQYVFDAIGDVASILLQKGDDLIAGLMSGWQTKSLELGTWAGNLGGWVAGQVGDVSGALYDVGVSLVAGIASGISAGAGQVAGAIQAIVGAIPPAIRALLGIGSPSRVMADLFQWVPAGAAVGIMRGVPDVERATLRMASAAAVPGGYTGSVGLSYVGIRRPEAMPSLPASVAGGAAYGRGGLPPIVVNMNGSYQDAYAIKADVSQAVREALVQAYRQSERGLGR